MRRPWIWGALCAVCIVLPFAHSSTPDMKRQIIYTPNAPKNPLYSQAVRAGGFIFTTGVPGVDPATNKPVGTTIQEQTRQSLRMCESILAAAGATLADVTEVQALLARPEDFAGLNEAYAGFFPKDPPVRSVARLGPEIPGVLVSIRMVAVVPD